MVAACATPPVSSFLLGIPAISLGAGWWS